jgi:hypothetical protein
LSLGGVQVIDAKFEQIGTSVLARLDEEEIAFLGHCCDNERPLLKIDFHRSKRTTD